MNHLILHRAAQPSTEHCHQQGQRHRVHPTNLDIRIEITNKKAKKAESVVVTDRFSVRILLNPSTWLLQLVETTHRTPLQVLHHSAGGRAHSKGLSLHLIQRKLNGNLEPMRYAETDDGQKITPYPGGRAKCPGCGGVVIAHCGIIYQEHWSHETLEDCDNWQYEPLTQWHLDWQNHFGIDNIEVTIKQDSQCHRADAIGAGEKIIEFQHSSISAKEIMKREEFYGSLEGYKDMLWVIDAGPFLRNINVKYEKIDVYKQNPRILKHNKFEKEFEIRVPADDDGSIKKALSENKFIPTNDTVDGENVWINRKSKSGLLPEDVYNAFHGYLLRQQIDALIGKSEEVSTVFTWKCFKKSWSHSEKQKYLDLNNGYMLKLKPLRINGGGYCDIETKETFLKYYVKKKPT